MRHGVRRALRLIAFSTIALLFVALFAPGRLEPGVRIYALVVSAVVAAAVVAALRRAFPPAAPLRPEKRHRERGHARPPSLARLELRAALGVADARDLHIRLRPHLRTLAAELLASRRGIDMDGDPDAARARLGAETWELVREDRPTPDDRRGRGLSPAALERVVQSLERV